MSRLAAAAIQRAPRAPVSIPRRRARQQGGPACGGETPSCATNQARPPADQYFVRLDGPGSGPVATELDASDEPAAWPFCRVGYPCRPPALTAMRYSTCESSAKDSSQRLRRMRLMSTRDLVTGAAAGAALLFVLDPNRGAKRRAMLRDKLVRAGRVAREGVNAAARDMSNRARGVAASIRGRFSDDNGSDDVVCERVRARLGRVSSH